MSDPKICLVNLRDPTINSGLPQDVHVKSPTPLDWRYDGSKIEIVFSDPVPTGEKRNFAITYTLRRPISGMHFSFPSRDHLLRPTFVVTDSETERMDLSYHVGC